MDMLSASWLGRTTGQLMHLQRCRGINNARLLLHSDPPRRHYNGHPSRRSSLLIQRHFFRATSIKPRAAIPEEYAGIVPRLAEGRRTEDKRETWKRRAPVPSEELAAPFLHVLASFLPKPSRPSRKFGFVGKLADCKRRQSRINSARSRKFARARARTRFRSEGGNAAESMAGKSPHARRPSAAIFRIAHRGIAIGITACYNPPFNPPLCEAALLIFPTFHALSPLVSSAASGHAKIPAFFLDAFTSVRPAAPRLYGVSFVPQLAPSRRLVFGRVDSFKRIANKSLARRHCNL